MFDIIEDGGDDVEFHDSDKESNDNDSTVTLQ